MRLLNFLLAEENVGSINQVKRECKDFLAEWKSTGLMFGALYRGMDVNVRKVKKFLALKYRLPKDTAFTSSTYLDALYKKTTGVSLRSSTTFATHDAESANAYGTIYYFLPVGKYTLWANPLIRDVFVDVFTPFGLSVTPKLAEPGKILNANSIIDAAKTDVKPNPETGSLVRNTAKSYLIPSVAALKDSDRIKLLRSLTVAAYLDAGYISEGILSKITYFLDKKNREAAGLKYGPNDDLPGEKLSVEKAYKIFWKPCFDELERRLHELFSQTRKVTLAQACNMNNEVMVQCDSYFLVNFQSMNDVWT